MLKPGSHLRHNDITSFLCRYVYVVMSLCRKCEPGFSIRSLFPLNSTRSLHAHSCLKIFPLFLFVFSPFHFQLKLYYTRLLLSRRAETNMQIEETNAGSLLTVKSREKI